MKNNIQKYVLISAALIERPYNPITVTLNTIIPNVYKYKTITENYVRNSTLSYLIIRPTELIGEYDDTQVMGYDIDQGDRISGKISRRSLS